MGQEKKQVEASNELTMVGYIYFEKRKDEKANWLRVRICAYNNLCCAYRTDEGAKTGEEGEK